MALGGLGVLRATDCAEAAFLGNVVSVQELVARLLGVAAVSLKDFEGAEGAFQAWRSKANSDVDDLNDLPSMPELRKGGRKRHAQRVLSEPVHGRVMGRLISNAAAGREQLRLRAVARQGAGAWWTVVPSRVLGLKFDRPEFLAIVRWWLGVPLFPQGGVCPEGRCSEQLDVFGDHAVCCPFGPSRIARHDGVNSVWAFSLKSAGFVARTEVYTDPESNRRSADTLVDSWEYGRQAAHDWVISHALQKSALDSGGGEPDYAVRQAEARKDSYAKKRCEEAGLDFIPLAMDTFGGLGADASRAIGVAVARARIFRSSALSDRSTSCLGLRQRLQVAAVRGIARQLLRRVRGGEDED